MVTKQDIDDFLDQIEDDLKNSELEFTRKRTDGDGVETYISPYKGRKIGLRSDGVLLFGAQNRKGRPPQRKVPMARGVTSRKL